MGEGVKENKEQITMRGRVGAGGGGGGQKSRFDILFAWADRLPKYWFEYEFAVRILKELQNLFGICIFHKFRS